MKKLFVTLVAAMTCLFLFAGCDTLQTGPDDNGNNNGGDVVTVETVAEKYGKLGEAISFVQEIEIKGGTLLQFESRKTYTKTSDGYTVKGTEKKLNDLSASEAYTTVTVDETAKAGDFETKLRFDETYYSSLKVENGVLKGDVLDEYAETVLGIGEDLPAAVHGMTLSLATDDTHVTRIEISYASGSSSVGIVLTFTY